MDVLLDFRGHQTRSDPWRSAAGGGYHTYTLKISWRPNQSSQLFFLASSPSSPAAWRHIHLNGHYTFRGDGQLIDLDAIVAGLELG